jgi:hypothetical protein
MAQTPMARNPLMAKRPRDSVTWPWPLARLGRPTQHSKPLSQIGKRLL